MRILWPDLRSRAESCGLKLSQHYQEQSDIVNMTILYTSNNINLIFTNKIFKLHSWFLNKTEIVNEEIHDMRWVLVLGCGDIWPLWHLHILHKDYAYSQWWWWFMLGVSMVFWVNNTSLFDYGQNEILILCQRNFLHFLQGKVYFA